MSRENVEVMRTAFDAWNVGDMDALRELLASDVVLRAPEGWPEPGPYVGREAVMRQWERNREPWGIRPPWSRSASSTPETGSSRGRLCTE